MSSNFRAGWQFVEYSSYIIFVAQTRGYAYSPDIDILYAL